MEIFTNGFYWGWIFFVTCFIVFVILIVNQDAHAQSLRDKVFKNVWRWWFSNIIIWVGYLVEMAMSKF